MDENTIYTENGIVNISDDVVQTITAMAVNELDGVSLPAGLAEGLVEKLVSVKKNYSKSIRIETEDKDTTVEVHILVDYGNKIQPLAAELQKVIKHNIETMTDLNVKAVNVLVDGIRFVKEPKKVEPEAEQDVK